MTDKERQEFIRLLETYKKKFSKSKKDAKEFLIEIGVYTEKGNLKKNYKHLCIPQEQA